MRRQFAKEHLRLENREESQVREDGMANANRKKRGARNLHLLFQLGHASALLLVLCFQNSYASTQLLVLLLHTCMLQLVLLCKRQWQHFK